MRKISINQKRNILLSSLGVFLFSFICIKVVIILSKYIVAWIFGIDTFLVSFRLMGISPSYSQVWSVTSVYAFYSIELIVPLIFYLAALSLLIRNTKKHTNVKVFYLWLGFTSFYIFFASIIAGIVTKTNIFHFLQWIYIPYYIMMLIAVLIFVVSIVFAFFYNKKFIIVSPIEEPDMPTQRTIMYYSVFLPLLIAIITLSVTIMFSFHKYELCELMVLFTMAMPAVLYFFPINVYYASTFSYSAKHRPSLFFGLLGCSSFLLIGLIKILFK